MKQSIYLLLIPAIFVYPGGPYANIYLDETTKIPPSTPPDQSPDTDSQRIEPIHRGKLLYDIHCKSCHSERIHSRASKKVRSIHDIQQWVIRWSSNLKLDWDKNDIDTVTDYLNSHFYRFPDKQ